MSALMASRRAFRLADAAVDADLRIDDEHVLALVEAIDRADLHAVHEFAFDAGFGDDISHDVLRYAREVPRATVN